ncbi:MAG: UDP-N-acetylmuramate--L-alanine ligase [Bacteroidota bacterium]
MGRVRHVHLVGIGGIGMSSIAGVLLSRGFRVSGSDLSESDVTEKLVEQGATVYIGHAAEYVADADVVVYSSAVKPAENPETIEALRQRIPLIGRAEMLAELMRMKYGIGIAGTHGKTTTTSMAGLVVRAGSFDPTVIVGGKVEAFGSTNAVTGEGDVIIIEADEYDRTFLRLTPVIAVITNIDAEHLDIYEDLDDLRAAFLQYANSVPFFGAVIACLDDHNVPGILTEIDRRVVTYGTARQADLRAVNIQQEGLKTTFTVQLFGYTLGKIVLKVPGLYNVRNALASVAVGLELDIPFDYIAHGLSQFGGVQRRFQPHGETNGVLVVDDYAHHPTEILATLEAASEGWPDRRLVVVFQPHLYSRTVDFLADFGRSFFDADVLVVTDIYPAREAPREGVTGKLIADEARRFGHRDVRYVSDKTELPDYVRGVIEPGDLVLWLGAGDIWRHSLAFWTALTGNEGQGAEGL